MTDHQHNHTQHGTHEHHTDQGDHTTHASMDHTAHDEGARPVASGHIDSGHGAHADHAGQAMPAMATMDHSEHAAHADHTGHEQMFRRRFWISLALSVPVLLFSPMIQEFLGFRLPAFAGSEWIPLPSRF